MSIRILLLLIPLQAFAAETSLTSFLDTAWKKSPTIKAESAQNEASEKFVSSARGKYLPHLSLDAIDSTGFAGANGQTGVSGLMTSPFREGFSGGVVLQQTIYDFGRISAALENAKAERSLSDARLAEEKLRFLLTAANIYLKCAQTRSLRELDDELMSWAKWNLRETARFTKTGQRSIVDNSLVQTEVNNLALEISQIELYRKSLTEQMGLFGVNADCQDLRAALDTHIQSDLQVEDPNILLARAQRETAHAGIEGAKANQLPTIQLEGSAGYMDGARLVAQENYGAGIGLSFPFWNGDEDRRREQGFKAQSEYQDQNLKTVQLEFDTKIKNLRDEYERQKLALTQLEKDLQTVKKTIQTASKRYHTLQGPLIDVREAFKQLREMGHQHLNAEQNLASVSLQLGLLRMKQ